MTIDNILIIEDDVISSMLLQYTIEDTLQANTITIKENGEEALHYLEASASEPCQFPKLIFLDLNMPLISGYDFIKIYAGKFATRFPDTQLVVLTSSVRKKDRELAEEYSAVAGFYNKPLEAEQLRQIKGVIESR